MEKTNHFLSYTGSPVEFLARCLMKDESRDREVFGLRMDVSFGG